METAADPRLDVQAALNDLVNTALHLRHAVGEELSLSLHEIATVTYLGRAHTSDQTRLGRLLGVTSSSVTGIIDRLQSRQLVQRVIDPTDRRRWLIELTDIGQDTFAELTAVGSHLVDAVDDDQVDALTRSLGQLTASMAEQTHQLRLRRRARVLDESRVDPR